jgi:hypothetical protein
MNDKIAAWKTALDGVYGSYILVEGRLSASGSLSSVNSPASPIVRVQSPLVCRSARSFANRCGMYLERRALSLNIVPSRRSVRRRNAVAARAFIAVHCVGAASLLP